MPENSCCDLKTERLIRHSRMATPDQTTIFISSTIFFQSNFAGLLKLPHTVFYLYSIASMV